ncbi:glycosyltransferase family 2 protein [Salinigranum sp.]|uniref:glycosyltransferase family 2 protein n=1 Tax=Salinigranum sp. TaxID=1966351 RepID=UPI0035692A47
MSSDAIEPTSADGAAHTPVDRSAPTVPAPRRRAAPVDDVPADGVIVAMPAYNEAGTVGEVVAAVRPHADLVLVVDDGSADDTAAEAERAGALVVSHPANRGYGGALKTIFTEAAARDAAHLVVIDADGQHTVADIPRLVAAQVETGANVVIGSRFVEGAATDAPLYRRLGLWVINALTNLSLGAYRPDQRLTDAQSGFRAYDAVVTRSLAAAETIGDCMAASLDILYHVHRHGHSVAEVGTTITYDVEHANSQNPLTQGFDLVSAIVATTVRDRPLFALGVPGAMATALGLAVPLLLVRPAGLLGGVGLAGVFWALAACGLGLCSLGLYRHLATRRERLGSPPYAVAED